MDARNYKPPEGGWGYLILCGLVTPVICAIGSVPSFGLLFNDFLNNIGEKSEAVIVITSVFFITFNFSGLITNILSKRFSKRSIVLSGSVLYILGSVLTVFVTTKMELLISYGMLQGAGFGFMTPISFAIFNSYFVKRRSFMMSVASTIMGLCITLYPLLVEYLKTIFGFRGCLMLIAAFNMHTFIAMLVMHPVEWHSKIVNISMKDWVEDTIIDKKKLPENCNENHCDIESEMGLMPPNTNRQDISNIHLRKTECNKLDQMRLGGLWSRIFEFFDFNLMRDPIYLNIALGISFATYSDATFVSFQPSYLIHEKFSTDAVATIIASGLGADLLSRIIYALATAFIQLKSRDMFLFGVLFMLVGRIAFMYAYGFTEVMVVNGIIGFFRAWIYITPNLIFAEYLQLSRFQSGFGLYMFLQGITVVVFGILISWIHSAAGQSYTVTFYVSHAMMLLCVGPWIMEMIFVRLHK